MKKIFIVDDNDTNIMAAKAALDGIYKTYGLPSAAKMFKLLDKILPDLILLDVDMPEMDGFETMQALKSDKRLRSVPVIFLTGKNDEATELKGFELGRWTLSTSLFPRPYLSNALKRISKPTG